MRTIREVMRVLWVLVALACMQAAWAQGARNAAPAAPVFPQTSNDRPETQLGPGDVVRITVYQNPDLTTEARISETGAINFPLIGSLPVAGSTIGQAEQAIAKKLRDGGFVL